MINEFLKHSSNNLNLNRQSSILLAISGGTDSVVMLDLFSKTDYRCAIAHCNFHLRGIDSNKDEEFVTQLASEYNYPLYKTEFDTKKYASQEGVSIEMAARDLRYEWFEKIRSENKYDYIATAHHKDDVVETFFLNLTRGTGIRGLTGIKALSDKLIRPLLFCERIDIIAYLEQNDLNFREDKSNNDVKIRRNKLRHEIIPELALINPAYKQNILKTINHLKLANQILKEKIDDIKTDVIELKENKFFLSINKIKKLNPLNFYLFEFLYPYGFNIDQVESIINSLDGSSGKEFRSNTHQLIKDRNFLILVSKQSSVRVLTKINDINELVDLDNNYLEIKTLDRTKEFEISKGLSIAALDKDKLKFPLEIRNWQNGDYFYPIGMNRKKKLSDFFIDNKISKIDKNNILLLTSQDAIVWVIGHRIDNRFKITDTTTKVIQISLHKK